jgi:superfamily II RNA helicase
MVPSEAVIIFARALALAADRACRVEHVFHEKHLGGITCPDSISFVVLTHFSEELAPFGIGVHHAGLTIDDRRAIEDLYLRGILRVVVATSVRLVLGIPSST